MSFTATLDPIGDTGIHLTEVNFIDVSGVCNVYFNSGVITSSFIYLVMKTLESKPFLVNYIREHFGGFYYVLEHSSIYSFLQPPNHQ